MIKSSIYNKIVKFLHEQQSSEGIEIYLQNGIRMTGQIAGFDEYAIELIENNQSSIVNTDAINTIVISNLSKIEGVLRIMEPFESKPLNNQRIQKEVCEAADKTNCEVEMFFLNRINLSGQLLRYDGDIMMVFSKVNRSGEWVSMLQLVNIDNLVSSTLKAPLSR